MVSALYASAYHLKNERVYQSIYDLRKRMLE